MKVYMNFTNSYELCRKNGMALVLPETTEENKAMSNLAGTNFFIDLVDTYKNGTYLTYLEGKSQSEKFWYGSEPDNPNDYCIRGRYEASTGKWDNFGCQTTAVVMCQLPKRFSCDKGEVALSDEEVQDLKSCYKIDF
ncbi:UNVERIFIED_CONTAM: hypothetical protein RMT77_011810 [Armadillidium vulgare]